METLLTSNYWSFLLVLIFFYQHITYDAYKKDSESMNGGVQLADSHGGERESSSKLLRLNYVKCHNRLLGVDGGGAYWSSELLPKGRQFRLENGKWRQDTATTFVLTLLINRAYHIPICSGFASSDNRINEGRRIQVGLVENRQATVSEL